jgi:hypothetical protein
MKPLITYIARALVDDPEAVSVRDAPDDEEGRKVIALQVAAEDRGKVIGKKGRMAHTMRTLLAAASAEGTTVTLDIVD